MRNISFILITFLTTTTTLGFIVNLLINNYVGALFWLGVGFLVFGGVLIYYSTER